MKPEEPQSVWQALDRQGEPKMEMRLTTDQLCTMARYRERENIWLQWIAIVVCVGLGALFVYWAIAIEQIWVRLAQVWVALLMVIVIWRARSWGARRIEAGESCAHFMVREYEGSRRTLLAIRWGIVLLVPWDLMSWWGSYVGIRTNALRLDPAWRDHLLTSTWHTFVAILLVLSVCWAGLGWEAKKRARQAEELRRAISN